MTTKRNHNSVGTKQEESNTTMDKDKIEFTIGWLSRSPQDLEKITSKLHLIKSAQPQTIEEFKAFALEYESLLQDKARLEINVQELKELHNLSKGKPLTRLQRHKREVQNIAQGLWDKQPSLTQASIARSDAVRRYLRGEKKDYCENTLLQWIREVDQRPVQNRRGRPAKGKTEH